MRILVIATFVTGALLASYSLAAAQKLTPQQYHKEEGKCACPDDKDSGGRRCGKRSAFCQQGGFTEACYRVNVERRRREACG
jgi:hypothetical protein